jgi:hypothetical protein
MMVSVIRTHGQHSQQSQWPRMAQIAARPQPQPPAKAQLPKRKHPEYPTLPSSWTLSTIFASDQLTRKARIPGHGSHARAQGNVKYS